MPKPIHPWQPWAWSWKSSVFLGFHDNFCETASQTVVKLNSSLQLTKSRTWKDVILKKRGSFPAFLRDHASFRGCATPVCYMVEQMQYHVTHTQYVLPQCWWWSQYIGPILLKQYKIQRYVKGTSVHICHVVCICAKGINISLHI